ncbi:unnamed protein product [Hyaloperonospora brassicae]|uniref:RxLR effector candidate protein n=1 Tax=Hyaloperonospora brassicae TaxID=162125 RepID=A0AAV0TDN3_HYABA|nr:unnamed protein product [Hyaloperonospora brassicae]
MATVGTTVHPPKARRDVEDAFSLAKSPRRDPPAPIPPSPVSPTPTWGSAAAHCAATATRRRTALRRRESRLRLPPSLRSALRSRSVIALQRLCSEKKK